MAQRQNPRRGRITCWGCRGAGHLRSSCPQVNKDHNIKCWGGSAKLQRHQHQHWTRGVRRASEKDQLADPEIKPIIEFKESSDEKPVWQDIAAFHPVKRYWALWDSLHLRNGVLYRKWESDDETFRWQLILPKTRVSTAFKELHGSPTEGHFGVMKTLQKVCECFYWNNVCSDVEKCCCTYNLCAACTGPRKRIRGRLQLCNVEAPFERIAFDILGPLPRSSDGNNIPVVMDYFTK
ncbi:retrovirus-related Pol polyprotein from transposon 412 [Trichonephila clavipes]|nr:retrovirus-related Pol polyprotein from transposon 412 [Trichonephila clavipes]